MRAIYVQYTNPAAYPPLQHSSRILANRGWRVLFLGTGAHGAESLDFPSHPNIRVKRLPFCPAGWRQKLHYAKFTCWVIVWALLWRPDLIYVSDLWACPLALLLSLVPGFKVLYHEHDSPNGDHGRCKSKFERFAVRLRSKAAQRIDLCIFPNEVRAERFRQDTGTYRPVLRVWNCPAREEARENPSQEEPKNFVAFYHGSIVPSRFPITVLQALARVPDQVVIRVAGYETVGHARYIEDLKKEAARLGLTQRLTFLGSFALRSELLDHCREASVGLAFMPLQSDDVNEQAMMGASNKPFDYLACGLALLVSELPEWKKTFIDAGYGLACDPGDPDSIAQQLLWFLQHPLETHSMGIKGRQRILSEWNYESQFSPVLQAIGALGVQH